MMGTTTVQFFSAERSKATSDLSFVITEFQKYASEHGCTVTSVMPAQAQEEWLDVTKP